MKKLRKMSHTIYLFPLIFLGSVASEKNFTTNQASINNQTVDPLKQKLEHIQNLVNLYYFPLIVTIGLIGNTLIIIILTKERQLIQMYEELVRKRTDELTSNTTEVSNNNIYSTGLKRKTQSRHHSAGSFSSTNYFLLSLAISDLIYNFILALLYITRLQLVNILHLNYVCQSSIAITYICSFLSAAFTTLFTLQRFVAVVFPLKSATTFASLQSKRVIRGIIAGLVVFSIVIYSYSFILYDTSPKKEHLTDEAKPLCGSNEKYTNLVYLIDNTLDSVLTLIIPSISIIIMNVAICKSLSNHDKDSMLNENSKYIKAKSNNKSKCQNDEELENLRGTKNDNKNVQINQPKSGNSNNNNNKKPTNSQASGSSSRRITKTLLIVSFAFVLLNSPYRLSKLVSYIEMSSKKQYVYSNFEFIINEVLCNLYFTSYSVNFFFYSFTGKKFREALKGLFFCCFYGTFKKISLLFNKQNN